MLQFLTKGSCQVHVNKSIKNRTFVRNLFRGDYFGEASLIYKCKATASVISDQYCTIAGLGYDRFCDVLYQFPDIEKELKTKSLAYEDPWKQYKIMLLMQVDYMSDSKYLHIDFYNEISYYMQDRFYE